MLWKQKHDGDFLCKFYANFYANSVVGRKQEASLRTEIYVAICNRMMKI